MALLTSEVVESSCHVLVFMRVKVHIQQALFVGSVVTTSLYVTSGVDTCSCAGGSLSKVNILVNQVL